MDANMLNEVLQKHEAWLYGKAGGERANLSGADLRDADLRDADLRDADLRDADLHRANLRGVDLSGADLRDANLRNANLSGAVLYNADLRDADLGGADLSGADLRYANLSTADLSTVDLSTADLQWCMGNSQQILTIQTPIYHVNLTNTYVYVGCQCFEVAAFEKATEEQAHDVDGEKAVEFFKKYHHLIMQHLELNRGT